MYIQTKFLGATDHQGSRIFVRAHDWPTGGKSSSVVWPYRHDLSPERNHLDAAGDLKHRLDPDQGEWIGIQTKDGYIIAPDWGIRV